MKPVRYPPLVLVALVSLSASPLPAADPASGEVPVVARKVRQLMQDRNYPEAIAAIEEAAAAEDAPRDYLAYLKGRSYYFASQYDSTVAWSTTGSSWVSAVPASPAASASACASSLSGSTIAICMATGVTVWRSSLPH